jgi:hypothetical protein
MQVVQRMRMMSSLCAGSKVSGQCLEGRYQAQFPRKGYTGVSRPGLCGVIFESIGLSDGLGREHGRSVSITHHMRVY